MTAQTWMVRAGRNAVNLDRFLDEGEVEIGWKLDSSIRRGSSKSDVQESIRRNYPNAKPGQVTAWSGQVFRMLNEFKRTDSVVTYDPGQRRYYMGTLEAEATVSSPENLVSVAVRWTHYVQRDILTKASLNSLGAILTLFEVPERVAGELALQQIPLGEEREIPLDDVTSTSDSEDSDGDATGSSFSFDDLQARATELIEDQLASLHWEDAQELIAGILRAMGYRTEVSPRGADRGVDVRASPDGLGLEEPRIFVEVKQRRGSTMGAPDLRSFLGGRQQSDRCLYVSTGGFSREARYEAERSTIPITLVDLPRLRALFIEHYESLDTRIAALVPLQRTYWPSSS